MEAKKAKRKMEFGKGMTFSHFYECEQHFILDPVLLWAGLANVL